MYEKAKLSAGVFYGFLKDKDILNRNVSRKEIGFDSTEMMCANGAVQNQLKDITDTYKYKISLAASDYIMLIGSNDKFTDNVFTALKTIFDLTEPADYKAVCGQLDKINDCIQIIISDLNSRTDTKRVSSIINKMNDAMTMRLFDAKKAAEDFFKIYFSELISINYIGLTEVQKISGFCYGNVFQPKNHL